MWTTTGVIIHFSNTTGESFKGGSGEVGPSFSISYANPLQDQLEHFRRVTKDKGVPVTDGPRWDPLLGCRTGRASLG
jgi:hypothetical protein